MTRAEFYSITALISRVATQWTTEGIISSLARGKGDVDVIGGSRERFCAEIRGLLAEIEKSEAPAPTVLGENGGTAT